MKRYRFWRVFFTILGFFLFFILISFFSAYTASNSVPSFLLDEDTLMLAPDDLAPDECAGLNLIEIVGVSGGGWTNGMDSSDLILGTSKVDRINASAGNDCIMGGDGNDRLNGDAGDDIILGGGGKDRVTGGDGYDICYGGGGNDNANHFDCEEVYLP
jgi:Ca2+-binding RTX toxin-like protein